MVKKALVSMVVFGCFILSGIAADKSIYPEGREAVVQAGFHTPSRKGRIWDTWLYFNEGRYYMHYLAGAFNSWDGHELALSDDGVHWKERGVMIKPREGVKWMGTGHIWKSPDFGRNHTWVMNYSEWFGDKQDIMFTTSWPFALIKSVLAKPMR
jgi:hypothetical protein